MSAPPPAALGGFSARGRRLSHNAIANLVGQVLVMLLVLLAGRVLYRALGADVFGVVLFGVTLAAALSAAFDLGLAATVVREVAAHRRTDAGYVLRLTQTAMLAGLVLFALLAALTWTAAPLLAARWLRLAGPLETERAVLVLRVLGISGLLAVPRSITGAVLRGLERMDVTNGVDVAGTALQQAGVMAAGTAGVGVVGLVAWLALTQVAWYAAYLVALARVVAADVLRPRWHADVAPRTLGFARHMGIISLLAVVHTQADRALVSRLLPIAAFGWYAFGYAALARATLVPAALAQAALPSLVGLHAAGDAAAFRARYDRLQSLLCLGIAPLFAAVPFAVPIVYRLVFDASAARALLLPLTLLAVGFYMNGTITLPYMASLAVGRPDIAVRSNSWALLCVLPATAALVWTLGLVGAGLSWVAYNVFAYAYALPRVSRECLGMSVRESIIPAARATAGAVVLFGPAWAAAWASGGGAGALLLAWAVAAALYAALALRLAGGDLRAVIDTLRNVPA